METDVSEQKDGPLSSTYKILTAERILDWCGVNIDHDQLLTAIDDERSLYFQLLNVPFKNIVNGIILQQAMDYQVYLQKQYVDYLTSGQGNETDPGSDAEPAPGGATRDSLEENRQKLIELNTTFDELTVEQKRLICATQAHLIQLVGNLDLTKDQAQQVEPIRQAMQPFEARAIELSNRLSALRTAFRNLILDNTRLFQLLPDYFLSDDIDVKNKEPLNFDNTLGEIVDGQGLSDSQVRAHS